jgi:hypothetical protein
MTYRYESTFYSKVLRYIKPSLPYFDESCPLSFAPESGRCPADCRTVAVARPLSGRDGTPAEERKGRTGMERMGRGWGTSRRGRDGEERGMEEGRKRRRRWKKRRKRKRERREGNGREQNEPRIASPMSRTEMLVRKPQRRHLRRFESFDKHFDMNDHIQHNSTV